MSRPVTRLQEKVQKEKEEKIYKVTFKPTSRSTEIGPLTFENPSNLSPNLTDLNLSPIDQLALNTRYFSKLKLNPIPRNKKELENFDLAETFIGITLNNASGETDILNSEKHKMANTTITQAFGNLNEPSRPSFVNPPIFDPIFDDAANFICNYKRTAIANAWDNNLKIAYLGSYLSGAANKWFTQYVTANGDKTWPELTEEFGTSILIATQSKFENCKQNRDENLKSYFYRLRSLAFDDDPNMADDRFQNQFEKGLAECHFRDYLLLRTEDRSIKGLKTIVDKIDVINSKNEKTKHFSNFRETNRYAGQNRANRNDGGYNRNFQKFDKRQTPSTHKPNFNCFNCNRRGHLARECPQRNRYRETRQYPNAEGRRK